MLNENHHIRNNIKTLRLLTESVDQKSITDAIEGGDIIYIYYQGDDTTNRGYRTIEPYTLGTHKSTGNLLLRAWQQAGASDTKRIRPEKWNSGGKDKGGWRLFNVDGISSFMQVGGSKGKFKDDVTPRPNYNPSDSELNVIKSYTGIYIPKDDTSKETSAFDRQTSGLKDFGVEDNDFQYKKNLTDLFGKVKFSRKQNPANYIVTKNPEGRLEYKAKNQEEKLDPQNVIGNLDTLFKDISGLQNTYSVSRGEFEKFQDELNDSGSLLGGQHNRPIDDSFFDKQISDFEKSLNNN